VNTIMSMALAIAGFVLSGAALAHTKGNGRWLLIMAVVLLALAVVLWLNS
jgi:hypothetical protein